MHRGARRAPIFKADAHCQLFLDLVEETVTRYGLEVHGYALLPNHYHLLVRSPATGAGLSRSMRHLNAAYTQQVNALHRWDGPVFRGRFHSQLVLRESHLAMVLAYLHLNPVRAGLVRRPEEECWTSHRAYLGLDAAPPWLRCAALTALVGGTRSLAELVDGLRRRRLPWSEVLDLDTGWFREEPDPDPSETPRRPLAVRLGSAALVAQTLRRVGETTGVARSAILQVTRGPRANPARRFAVWALHRTQRLTQAQIGEALGMSVRQVAAVLSRLRAGMPPPLEAWRKAFESEAGT
jgi:REP element-mobilizing transposase RayT